MDRKVTLYTDNSAQPIIARTYLNSNKVDFEEIDTAEGGGRIVISRSRLPLLQVKASHGISAVFGFDEFQYSVTLNHGFSYDDFVKARCGEARLSSRQANMMLTLMIWNYNTA